jgi:hypothetical protein
MRERARVRANHPHLYPLPPKEGEEVVTRRVK